MDHLNCENQSPLNEMHIHQRTIGMTFFSIGINPTIGTNGPSELTNRIRLCILDMTGGTLLTRAQILVLMEYVLNDPTSYLRELEQYLIDSTASSLILIFIKVRLLLGLFNTRTNILRVAITKRCGL